MNTEPTNTTSFRENIAKWISTGVLGATAILGGLGIALAIVHLVRTNDSAGVDKAQEILQFTFSALLPLWGTWIGTVLAYYFSKENFESANKQVRELVGQVTAGSERLKSLGVTDVMMPFDQILREGVNEATDPDSLGIADLYKNITTKQIRRSLIFKDRKIIYALHKSLLSDFLFRNPNPVKPLTIADMKLDFDKDIQNAFSNGVQTIGKTATLLDVKHIMDLLPGCQDVFVTENGKKEEPVLGWISNVDVMNKSKA